MRRRLWLALLAVAAGLGLLAAACAGDGSSPDATPTASLPLPQPTPGDAVLSPELSAVILPLMPDPEDVPPALGQLGPPELFDSQQMLTAFQSAQLEPLEVASWQFLGGASSSLISLLTPPEEGPEFLVASIFLHANDTGAKAFFEFSKTFPSKNTVYGFEGLLDREVTQYAEFVEPAVGDETRIIVFSSHPNDDETIQYQNYYVYSRRGRVVVVTFGRAITGEIGLDDLVELASNMDASVVASDL